MSRITESGHPFDHHEVDLLNASDEELRGIAEALGLGAGIAGAFEDKALAQVLKLPPAHEPLLVMPVGYKS